MTLSLIGMRRREEKTATLGEKMNGVIKSVFRSLAWALVGSDASVVDDVI